MFDSKVDIDTAAWVEDQYIPGLKPYGLDRVPGWRPMPGVTIPRGWHPTPGEPSYEDPAWRQEHKDWTRELVHVARPWIHARGNADTAFADLERLKNEQDPNYFGAVYGWIQDPQPLPDEEVDKPYAKFAYQCDNTTLQHRWLYRDRRIKAKIWRSKSRQLGISWDDETFDAWFLIYGVPGGAAKLVSRSEKWVDAGLSTEAMFGKIKYILAKIGEHTPYLLPDQYPVEKWLAPPYYSRKTITLVNPVTGVKISGEATTKKVARGGTYTYGRADEDAFIPDLTDTLTSMQGACPRIFLASTESFENGMEHLDGWQGAKREGDPDLIREYNWHQNAYLDLDWERKLFAGMTTDAQRQGAMREYFRDPFAGFGTWVYPEARDIPEVNRPYHADEPLDITMDPAGSGDDLALMACQATGDNGYEGFHVLWGYERRLPNPLRVAHIATGIWPDAGDACYPWQPDDEERKLGEFLYDCWINERVVRWFMDPAGDQIHSSSSFWLQFRDLTRILRQREVERLTIEAIARHEGDKEAMAAAEQRLARLNVPVSPRFKALKDKRLFADREYAFRRYLPHVTVQTGVRSALRVKECAYMTAYNELSKAAITEPKRKHDQYSHQASNLENYSLYYTMGFIDPLDLKTLKKQMKAAGPRKPGIPSGFGNRALPGGFGKKPALPPHAIPDRTPPPGTKPMSPGGFR